jgi:AspBHI-like restriction endonuclease/restriction endonuclease
MTVPTHAKPIAFADLAEVDHLIVDATYEGGQNRNTSDDPISKLVGCGNQGGFRFRGSARKADTIRLVVLYSELTDPDWPDTLDVEKGQFIYFGDNKSPGRDIASKKGNRILEHSFNSLHSGNRQHIPPFLVFTKGPKGRDVVFRGLAAPGYPGLSQTEDLVAVWRSRGGQRFANYRAVFTILKEHRVSRKWLTLLAASDVPAKGSDPRAWEVWRTTGKYTPLLAPKTRRYRTSQEQLPANAYQTAALNEIVTFFKQHPDREYAFEKCAAELLRLMDPNVVSYDLTRPWRDGGRDATGVYRIGSEASSVLVEFALEAKCKGPRFGSGVKEVSRLISRLRYRQFGVFITTSFLNQQAYCEIIEDGHPVLILAGIDIIALLTKNGFGSVSEIKRWLEVNFSS